MRCSDLPPALFEFYIGASAGPSLYIRCEGGIVRYERSGGGSFSGEVNEICPASFAWAAFWSAVEKVGVWGWAGEYTAAHSCCDVTYWHLRLDDAEGRTISTRGADAYPKSGFSGFVAAVYSLIRVSDNPFRYLR